MGGSNGDASAPVTPLAKPPELPPAEHLDPKEIVDRFVAKETSMEERMGLLREPYDPVDVRKQLEAIGDEWESGIVTLDYIGQAQMLDLWYHGYYAHFRNGQERYLCAVEQRDGFRIDWDAYARSDAKSAWAKLLAGDLSKAEMQVTVVPGNYHNYGFSDALEYTSFVLRAPDCEEVIFGYARRFSVTEKIILQTVEAAVSPAGLLPVLMKLRLESFDQSNRNKQFLISHVVATSWVASTAGTVEQLWVDSEIDEDMSADDLAAIGGLFDAPLMYQQGLELQATDPEGAARYFRKALENLDDFHAARVALGRSLIEQNRLDEAEVELNAVLAEDPNNAEAHHQMAICAVTRGNMDLAASSWESTVRLDPEHALALNNLAWILATHRDKSMRSQSRVVELAERAVKLGNESQPSQLATLAVAYAAAGRFEDAVKATEKALGILRESGSDQDLEAKLAQRLALFRNLKTYEPE
ncbi:MAG: tetratricopeptide repeat protein [Verrucomicrobia bacterium]|nr:tetratricopeptide repeat protein [Verrucomicrobiota bacterium]